MHIFIIALFLIHECRHSSGLPARPNESSPLQHLANTCENAFLADKISKKVNNCKFNGSVPNQSDLVCYMFYDINTQLCAAFQHSEFNLQGNYDTKMKERQNVATLCDSAKAWKFATMQPNSPYNVLLKVFSDPVYCQKLCGVDDFLSDDANDYCTYFMWGTEVIQSQAQTIPLQDKNLPALAAAPALNTGKSSPTAASINNTNVAVVAAKADEKSVDTKLAKPSATAKEGTEKSEHKSPPTSTANHTGGEKTPDINSGLQVLEPSLAPIGVSSVKADPDHPAVEEEPPKKDEVENNGLALEKPKELIDVNGKPEDVNPEDDENDNDDYDQHDEVPVKIDKNDNGGVESDPEVVVKGNNNPALKIEAITLPPQRVADIMYPNGIPDSFTDDDDHFFPIFLTGIIIVVLLYILYHNKTKFTKVILGLIVEGRQSGRRRNSRGHAYRRLDTLEQAMSSSTAAPPSKIIY